MYIFINITTIAVCGYGSRSGSGGDDGESGTTVLLLLLAFVDHNSKAYSLQICDKLI